MLLLLLGRYVTQNYGLGRDLPGIGTPLVTGLVVYLSSGDKLEAGSRIMRAKLGEPDPPYRAC